MSINMDYSWHVYELDSSNNSDRLPVHARAVLPAVKKIPFVAIFVVAFIFVANQPSAAQTLFGFTEERLGREDIFYRKKYWGLWQRILDGERKRPSFTVDGSLLNREEGAQWRNLVRKAGQNERIEALRMVNGFFNKWRSKSDSSAWNSPDYWASPSEFISKRGGDCEDYAIAKYFALRFLGVTVDDLRVVLVRQRDVEKHGQYYMHAVLAARARDIWYILDNNSRPIDGIFLDKMYAKGHFIPLYSFNESTAWKYVKK